MTARTPEGRLKQECGKVAGVNRLAFWQIEGKGINGIPDTLAQHTDRKGFVLIEFKTETGALSEQQMRRIERLRDGGQRVAVCRTVDEYMRAVGLTGHGEL
jgi:hypothetical protein